MIPEDRSSRPWKEAAGEWRKVVTRLQMVWLKLYRLVFSQKWFPGALVSLVTALFILSSVQGQFVRGYIGRYSAWMLLAVLFLYFNVTFCRAFVLFYLMGERVSYTQSLVSLAQGQLIDILLPLKLGDTWRAFLLGRKIQTSYFDLRGTIRMERFLDASLIVFSLFLALNFFRHNEWLGGFLGILLCLLIVILLALPLVSRSKPLVMDKAKQILERLPRLNQWLGARVYSFFEGATHLAGLRQVGFCLFLRALAWAFRFLGLFILVWGLVPRATLWYGVFTAGVLAFSSLIPSARASLAVYEGAILLGLHFIGVDATIALSVALTSHIIDLVPPFVLGGITFLQEKEDLPALYTKLIQLQ